MLHLSRCPREFQLAMGDDWPSLRQAGIRVWDVRRQGWMNCAHMELIKCNVKSIIWTSRPILLVVIVPPGRTPGMNVISYSRSEEPKSHRWLGDLGWNQQVTWKCVLRASHMHFPRKPGPPPHPHFTNFLQNRLSGAWCLARLDFYLSTVNTSDRLVRFPKSVAFQEMNDSISSEFSMYHMWSLQMRWPRRRGHLSRYTKYLQTVNDRNVQNKWEGALQWISFKTMLRSARIPKWKVAEQSMPMISSSRHMQNCMASLQHACRGTERDSSSVDLRTSILL